MTAAQSWRPDVEGLFVGLVAGVFGVAYFVYGKRQARFSAMIAGVMLCIYPYFIDSLLWLCVVGVLLLIAPFVIDYQMRHPANVLFMEKRIDG